MIVNLTKNNAKNNLIKNENPLKNEKEKFKKTINDIFSEENCFLGDSLKNTENFLYRYIWKIVNIWVRNESFLFLEKFKNLEYENNIKYLNQKENLTKDEEKQKNFFIKNLMDKKNFEDKFKKYFSIHEEIIFKTLNEEIEKLEDKDIFSIKNVVKNVLRKYTYILFIFSEKVKLSDLEKYLKTDIAWLSFLFSWARNDIKLLDNFWWKVKETLKSRYDIEDNEENPVIDNKFFSGMYRRLYKEIEKNENQEIQRDEKSRWEEIWKKLEDEVWKSLNEIFYIFETWVESGWNDDLKLRNLEIFTRKILEWIVFLKKQEIAFNSLKINKLIWKDTNVIINEFLSKILIDKSKKSNFYDEFKLFINLVCGHKNDLKDLKDNLIKTVKQKNNDLAKTRIPEKKEKIENLDIEKIDFPSWIKIPEEQKYDFVFSKVIAENWKIKFADFLKLESKDFYELFELYSDYYIELKRNNNKKEFKENLKKQFEDLLKSEKKWLTVEDFIKNDVNNLNTIILWWRFLLKIRFLEEAWYEKNIKNLFSIKEISEKEYWVVEKISEKLDEKWLIDNSNDIIFSIDWKVRNTSIEQWDIWINDLIIWLKKWFIDLSKEKIKLINWEEENIEKEKIIWKIIDLYIPAWLTAEKTNKVEKDIHQIISHLDNWIDFCYKILKNEEIIKHSWEENYWNILIENKIIDKIENFNIEEKVKIQHLVEILKFIKSRVKILKEMIEIAEKDRENLWKNIDLSILLSANQKSSFWPKKSFNRAFIKLIWEYGGDFNKLWDLTRARVVSKTLDESVEKAIEFVEVSKNDKNITNVSIVDSTWEPISMPKKDSWYRDIKIFLKMSSWNTVEVQFQVEDMYEVKDKWLNLTDEKHKWVFEKMEKEWALLNEKEINELLKISNERNIILPTREILENLLIEKYKNIDWENYENILIKEEISTDYSYHIVRQLDENSQVRKKLTRLERVLADYAWAKIVIKYLNDKNIKIK